MEPKSVFVLTRLASGPQGHGEPGEPHLCLATDGEWFSLGNLYPCFMNRDDAERFVLRLAGKGKGNYKVTELEMVDVQGTRVIR